MQVLRHKFTFSGTQGFLQLLIEADKTVLAKKDNVGIGGRVSAYFYNAYKLLWSNGLGDDFANLRKLYPDYAVWVRHCQSHFH